MNIQNESKESIAFDSYGINIGNKEKGKIMSTDFPMVEIVKIVTNNDKKVVEQVVLCGADIEKYFADNRVQYEQRGIEDFEEKEENTLCWLGMVDILEQNGYVCERDWKDEKEDFISFVSELNGVKEHNLTIEDEWFDEDGYVAEWASVIDEKWMAYGMCLASIDIGGDCYVLFACKLSELESLKELSEKAGFRIDFAKNM